MTLGPEPDAFATLTHARVRVRQGDRRGARGILRRLLQSAEAGEEAACLLREVERDDPRAAADRRLVLLRKLLERVGHNREAAG